MTLALVTLAQFPLPPEGMTKWLAAAAVIATLILAWQKLFGNGHTLVRRQHCESRHSALERQLERIAARSDARLERIEGRIAAMETRLARIDERTRQ